jgi:hypothetical protein
MDIWRRHGQRLLAAVEVREWEREAALNEFNFQSFAVARQSRKKPFQGFLSEQNRKTFVRRKLFI